MKERKPCDDPKKTEISKKLVQLRMRPLLRRQLDLLVQRNESTLTEEIQIAVREKLERVGLWPLPQGESSPSKDPE